MLKIFINNQWVEYDYTTLHNSYGITETPSIELTLYNESHTLLESWENDNSIWVESDHQWYPKNNTPYYLLTDQLLEQYRIDVKNIFSIYDKQENDYVYLDSSFITTDSLYSYYGYTDTPSTSYILYDDNSTLLEAWENNHYVFVEKDHQWYAEDNIPYAKPTQDRVLYFHVETPEFYDILIKSGTQYVSYHNSLIPTSTLHDYYGYTLTPSFITDIYNDNIQLVTAWKNNTENAIFIENDHQWYTLNNLPYYSPTTRDVIYYTIDVPDTYPIYNKQGVDYIIYNYSFGTYTTLHNSYGITTTPSTVLLMKDSNINPVVGWENSNEVYIETEHQWYSLLENPYYVELNQNLILYRIGIGNNYPLYNRQSLLYALYNHSFVLRDTLIQNLYSSLGYTFTPSTVYELYDSSIDLIEAWENNDLIWVENDHLWYPKNNLPYYSTTDREINLYRIGNQTAFSIYCKQTVDYVIYQGVFYTVLEMYNLYGITQTQSNIVSIYDSSYTPIIGWENNNYVWIEKDSTWYSRINTPYYIQTEDTQSLYRSNTEYVYPIYDKQEVEYLYYNSSFEEKNTLITTLYNTLGITTTISTPLLILSDPNTELEGWENNDLIWVENDHLWYPKNNTPYFVYSDNKEKVYRISQEFEFPVYIKNGDSYLLYDHDDIEEFVNPSIIQDLHDYYGYTRTPSKVYYSDQGVPWAWYNQNEDSYWDDRAGRKYWSDVPPVPEDEGEGIPKYPDPFTPLPQWENDLSQIPTVWSRSGNFIPTYETPQVYKAFRDWDTWEDYQNVFNDDNRFYPDNKEYNVNFYVYPEEGAEDYDGVHHDQGDVFVGDHFFVWVESDTDSTFYQGSNKFIYGQSHDDNHPELFYIDPLFYTPEDMHSLGYTRTEGENVEIWDMNLMGQHLWNDIMWLYTTPSTSTGLGANIPDIENGATKAYFTRTIEDRTFSGIAKETGENGNNLKVVLGYSDINHKFSVIIYENDILVYSKQCTTVSDLNDNTYIDFSGNFLSIVPTSNLTLPLSGGTSTYLGVPIYYEDGTPVLVSDYVGQNIIYTKQIKLNRIDAFVSYHYETQTCEDHRNDHLSFIEGPNHQLYLQKSSGGSLDNILGFSFTWNNEGENIEPIRVGITRWYRFNANQNQAVRLNSKYYWVYSFSSIGAENNNWWNPQYYWSSAPPRTQSTLQTVPGAEFAEVLMTDPSDPSGIHNPTQFYINTTGSKPEIYFDTFVFDSTYKSQSGVLIDYGTNYTGSRVFNLPNDLYTINDKFIVWNINHPLYKLYYGKPVSFTLVNG